MVQTAKSVVIVLQASC